MCVYPDGVWYKEVDSATARAIVEDHIVRGQIVKRHLLHDIKNARENHPLLDNDNSMDAPQGEYADKDETAE
jgi:(2Fe-2S) ferredoxin